MDLFCRQRDVSAVLALATALFAFWFGLKSEIGTMLIFVTLSLALFVALLRQNRKCNDARLILNNKILVTPTVVVRTEQGEKTVHETIVSSFGLLATGELHAWGNQGLTGPRLKTVELDRLHIRLSFGNAQRTTEVELLHGLTEKGVVEKVQHLLWRETGVTAKVVGW